MGETMMPGMGMSSNMVMIQRGFLPWSQTQSHDRGSDITGMGDQGALLISPLPEGYSLLVMERGQKDKTETNRYCTLNGVFQCALELGVDSYKS